ncbi:hypothetical protein AB7W30_19555 [Providencia manganoxydans]|uniref:hypothetical protein n=1 Tax=Providencia manganoxydans TaxID=2923283 RepID=UPI0032DA0AFC
MAQEKNITRSRLPRTEGNKKLIPMRLFETENNALELLAEKESRSKSAMARMIFLAGLKLYKGK